MNPKRILIVGTMALTITIGGGLWNKEACAHVPNSLSESPEAESVHLAAANPFLQAIGADSEQEVYDALLDGKSLAAIAAGNDKDVQNIINLQIAELTEQLDLRLADGTLLPTDYEAQKAELADIINKSVYGEKYT